MDQEEFNQLRNPNGSNGSHFLFNATSETNQNVGFVSQNNNFFMTPQRLQLSQAHFYHSINFQVETILFHYPIKIKQAKTETEAKVN